MRRLLFLVAACGHPATPHSTEDFTALSTRVLDHLNQISPAEASDRGSHEFDGVLADLAPATIDANVALLRGDETALASVASTTGLEREERDTLLIRVRGTLFALTVTDTLHTNPMSAAGDFNLDSYLSHDYAPIATRAEAVAKLCTGAAHHLEQARALIKLPVPKPWLETARVQFAGYAEFADKDMRALMPDIGTALDACKAAFTTEVAWIDAQLPHATGDFALGTDKFLGMLEASQGIKIDLKALKEMAQADLDRNTHAMEEAAHEIDPKRPVADVVADVLKPRPADVLAEATTEVAQLRQFLIDHHIVTVPGPEVATVRPTPSFDRWNQASLSGVGPFETKAMATYYNISPPDPSWAPDVQAAYVPPTVTLPFVTAHEVYPGHFINQMHMNRITSRVEKSVWMYTTGEGWAHYAEEMMYDEGLGNHTPQAHIGQLTEALLRNVRFVVAIGEHTGGMTVEQAEQLFIAKAFLDKGNAEQQAKRGTFDPMYLAYTVGKLGIMKMRTDWKVKHPKGTLQEFHDAFLAHGAAPLSVIRRALVGDDDVL